MVDQTYEPVASREGWESDDDAFPDAVEQLVEYSAGERTGFDIDLDLVGTEFQRQRMDGIADDSVRRDRVIGANGSLTGYGGGLDRKRPLLELEKRRSSATPTLFE